jgi:hypothetical protein
MTRSTVVLLGAAVLCCCSAPEGDSPTGTAAQASSSPAPGSAAPSASASVAPRGPIALPKASTVTRTQTPSERARTDDAACEQGDARACRRVADRFRGYGAPAGCGVTRDRPSPAIKVQAEDWAKDHERFTRTLQRACRLGDSEACTLHAKADDSLGAPPLVRKAMSLRSSTADNGLWQFQTKIRPEWGTVLEGDRRLCLTTDRRCDVAPTLHRRVKRTADEPLPADVAEAAIGACAATHDCDDIMMVLDRSTYRADQLGKVRAAFATTLREACVAGECTCGSAVRYTDDDAVRFDLSVLGCENGEADACAQLAERLQEGRGAPRDPERAFRLLETSCPPFRSETPEEYSRLACDRLSRQEEGDALSLANWERTLFYAQRACPTSGFELDHAPCVHLGMVWAKNPKSTGRNGEDARIAAWGSLSNPTTGECSRPSVKAECEAFERTLAHVR